MEIFIFILAVVIICFVGYKMRIPKCGNMILVTGGVKTGKTTLSVHLVKRIWKKQKTKAKISNAILFCLRWIPKFRKKQYKPMPLIYSNIPLSIPYVPLTKDMLERNERFVYGSVIYCCEASLIADSMCFKDAYVNEQLLLFNKLIAHETRGGYIIYDTQSIADNHFAVKRCLSSYFYIHHAIKIPFFVLMYVRELKFSEDNSAVNTFEDDASENLELVIVPKKVWKLFDCYCYSALTDHLPVADKPVKAKSLKAKNIVSFKNFKKLFGGKNED